jgi:cobalt/nickel transport system permease protein
MHIPDGYLSPATAAVMYAASAPFWYRASQKIKTLVTGRFVPMIALFAAFAFVVQMFNIPLPGGTTGHAVGATLATIVLGPWASVLAVSVALIIQALFFGDGGILAIGANVFNMAIAMSFVAFWVYRAISGDAPITSSRRIVAAAIAGYVAINAAALLTAIELGIQPMLFRDAAGRAIYFPYGLQVAIPAMMLGHLTIAGAVEAIVTGLVVAWLQRTNPELLETFSGGRPGAVAGMPHWAWTGLLALIALTPIGLLAPGTAWGEWGREELEQLGFGYIPAGFDQWSSFWSAPIPDYDIPALENPTVAYVASAVFGVALVLAAIFALAWLFARLLGATQPASTRMGDEERG